MYHFFFTALCLLSGFYSGTKKRYATDGILHATVSSWSHFFVQCTVVMFNTTWLLRNCGEHENQGSSPILRLPRFLGFSTMQDELNPSHEENSIL
mmetsp:Transcript_8392/g.18809  ORF Transcript_8392/g.18809 Transcript_8392/m.18809 type:complete len:95 (+) Transcript_8392:517-801(+)